MNYKPKLIEVALPLLAINEASAREKSIRHGHPSTLHLWWARRPLAAARAVIWASLVDDPSGDETLTEKQQETERQRLFGILERLVVWENSNNEHVLAEARAEIDRCFPGGPPPILDPFGGGGAIPLEAQRLGLTALSGDLNPVAVLIQKAMLEIPPRFAGRPPVHPDIDKGLMTWDGAQGLAADVEAYARGIGAEAERRIGQLYPDAVGPEGDQLAPLVWIWARTVESPDPTWDGHVPLTGTWTLVKKAGRKKIWIEPSVDREHQIVTYQVRDGSEPKSEPTMSGGNGYCIATGAAIPGDYIRQELIAGRGGYALLAVVAEGPSGRRYVSPSEDQIDAATSAAPQWWPESKLPEVALGFRVQRYGLDEWRKLFTPRQLCALTTFSDLLDSIRPRIVADAIACGYPDDSVPLREGGLGAVAYADAITTYLAFAIDRMADRNSSMCSWDASRMHARNVFARQAISMTWDFAENNPLGDGSGSWVNSVTGMTEAIRHLPSRGSGHSQQRDARARVMQAAPSVAISTDPPYYDNIGYADLSDFFFVWMRKNLRDVWPDECATLLTPKSEQLIADPGRHGGRRGAERHFESGMSEFMEALCRAQTSEVPATIYYAYKATESSNGEIRSTGWDTFLQAVVDAGLSVTATWPLRTELGNRMRGLGSNALASSIVLACRRRDLAAPLASRGEFVAALRAELPDAVRILQSGNIAPVDIPQSTIGPGIGVFSRYSKVVESDGSAMKVSAALSIINDELGEILDGEESELDADSRFALTWYSQYGYNPSSSGAAGDIARAKNTSLDGLRAAGIGETRDGKFRLLERAELPAGWSPTDDARLTVWEATQHLIAALERSETEAAELLHRLGGYSERARVLAYLLFKKATDKGWAAEAGAYNGLIAAWPSLRSLQLDAGMGQQSMRYESE